MVHIPCMLYPPVDDRPATVRATSPIGDRVSAVRAAGLLLFRHFHQRWRADSPPPRPPPPRYHRPHPTLSPPLVFYRPAVPLEASAFLRDLVRRAAPRGLRDPAEDVRAAAARAVRLVMRRFLLQEARSNDYDSEKILVHAIQRPRKSVGGSDAGSASGADSGSGGSGGGSNDSGSGIDGGEVFDLVWEALEGLDLESACVEVRVPLVEREMCLGCKKVLCCCSRKTSWPGKSPLRVWRTASNRDAFDAAGSLRPAGCGFQRSLGVRRNEGCRRPYDMIAISQCLLMLWWMPHVAELR